MKKRTLLCLVLSLVVFGGGAWMAKETNLFLSPRAKQLAYLKEHEEDMADFVKALSPKVESVQFNWDSMEVGTSMTNSNLKTFDNFYSNLTPFIPN